MKLTHIILLCVIGFVAIFLYSPLQEIPDLKNAAILDIGCYQNGSEKDIQLRYSSYNSSLHSEKKEEVERCGKMFAKIVKHSNISAHNAALMRLIYTEDDICIFFYGPHINSPIPYVNSSLPSDFTVIGKELMNVVDGLDENSISSPWIERNPDKWVMHAKRIATKTRVSTQ